MQQNFIANLKLKYYSECKHTEHEELLFDKLIFSEKNSNLKRKASHPTLTTIISILFYGFIIQYPKN